MKVFFGLRESIKEQLEESFQAKLNAAGLSHVRFRILADSGQYEIEGFRDLEEKDKAMKVISDRP